MHQFDQDIALIPRGEMSFSAEVTNNWSVNGNPDGGYLMAMLANAIRQAGGRKNIVLLTGSFLTRCEPGPAVVSIEKIGSSRRFDRWQATLSREEKKIVQALGTCENKTDDASEKRYERSAPDLPPVDRCTPFPQIPNYTLFNRMDVRLDPECFGWIKGELVERSEHRGWIRFREDRAFDELSLLLMVDSFPPPVLASQGAVAWVPTIELSVNIRNLPKTEWVKGRFRSRFINNGIVEEDAELWDEEGELLAISRQVSQFKKGG